MTLEMETGNSIRYDVTCIKAKLASAFKVQSQCTQESIIQIMPNLTARFQPYTLALYDSHSHDGFATRQFVTLPSLRKKIMFMLFLRRKCQARRRGNWARIPGNYLVTKAMDYATRHGGYVYDLRVEKVPIPRHHRSRDAQLSDSDSCDSAEENVPEEDILSGDENL